MPEHSDAEIRQVYTQRALLVDVKQDQFGRPVIIAEACIEAVPRLKGEPNPEGTFGVVEPNGRFSLTPLAKGSPEVNDPAPQKEEDKTD